MPEKTSDTTDSGIILTEKKEKPVIGKVIVGNSVVNKGERVIFSKFGYDEVEIDKQIYYLVSEPCLLAIL